MDSCLVCQTLCPCDRCQTMCPPTSSTPRCGVVVGRGRCRRCSDRGVEDSAPATLPACVFTNVGRSRQLCTTGTGCRFSGCLVGAGPPPSNRERADLGRAGGREERSACNRLP